MIDIFSCKPAGRLHPPAGVAVEQVDFAGGDGEVEGVAGFYLRAAGQAGEQGIAAGCQTGMDYGVGAQGFDQFDLDGDVADALAGLVSQVFGTDA